MHLLIAANFHFSEDNFTGEKWQSLHRSHKIQHSLEIWPVKLRFLLIYENMFKSITTARSECTAKQENKASYNTDYIVPDLIDFFGDD